MPQVYIPPSWLDATGGTRVIEVEGETLRHVVDQLQQLFPELAVRLTRDGRLREGLAVAIDGVVTSRGLYAAVAGSREIHFLPAIGGG